jgi:N-acetylmuramoyl-L-alanine amidase
LARPRLAVALISLVAATLGAPLVASLALAADPIVVAPGDTLTSIAERHGVSVERIVELNAIDNPNRIYAGQRLRLEPVSTPAPAAAAPATAARTHVVRSGEHLTGIARHYGLTVAAIASANGLADPSRIFAGQRLTIPGWSPAPRTASAPTAPTPATAARTHVVRSGEHLTGIARHYGLTVAAIASANGLADPSRIFAGQRLTIPASSPAPRSSSAPAARMPAPMSQLVRERDAVRRVIVEEANRFGVPAAFALAVAWQESGWQQSVVSHAGAIGVMQLLPMTAEWVGDAMLGTRVDPRDLRQNVRAGVRLLAHYLDRYEGSRDLALAAYYQGQTAADRHGVYAVSRPYIASIRVLESMFGG